MRLYIGEVDEDAGRCRVWVAHEESRPDIHEVVEVLGELNKLMEVRRDGRGLDEGYEAHRAATIARKNAIVEQLRAAENVSRPTELIHRGIHSPDGFEWGHRGAGPADLAYSILLTEIGEPPTPPVYLRFRDDIVAELPVRSFRLPSAVVWEWITANRSLVEHELFEKIPPPDAPAPAGPALAVTEPGSAPEPEAEAEAISDASGSAVVRACEQAWRDIQAHHADLPDVVVILGSGVERGRLVKLGHWWGGRWLADGEARGEVLLAGEALHLPPEQVFEVLLHEAAHGLNAARRIPDTSRGGRYHNRRFAATASEVLLEAEAMPPYGFAATKLTVAAKERYALTIERLGDAMRIARQIDRGVKLGADAEGELGAGRDHDGPDSGERGRKDAVTAVCGCGRRLRMAPSVWEQGAVACGRCGTAFEDVAERRAEPEAGDPVVDDSFLARRRAVLDAEATARRGGSPAIHASVVQAQRARLSAALAAEPGGGGESVRPLQDRLDRIERLLAAADLRRDPGMPTPATPWQRDGVRELLQAGADPDDLAAVGRWYETVGTPTEQPMPRHPAGGQERTALARALLKADGTITGPSLPLGDSEVAAGDRIVATRDVPGLGLAAGTPGKVERVDEANDEVRIDFATSGRFDLSVGEMAGAGISHAYIDHEATTSHHCDVTEAIAVEANRIEPGAGW
ncbi:MAG: DUF6166 domain-containing protein [Acidimicrobiales bacterium]